LINTQLKFCAKLLMMMTCLFWLHSIAIDHLGLSVQDELLRICYLFNTIFAMGLLVLLLFVSKQEPSILGWIFLFSSGVKFLLFFVLIYPSFQTIGHSAKQEFWTFFIPYTAALILEIHQYIKTLNREN